MNHQKVYESIIENTKLENRVKLKKNQEHYIYYENHHILPKCLGGGEEKENKVLLTAKEHYVCHKLLTYIYPGNRKLANAFHYMTYTNGHLYNASSRDYEYAKELHILIGLTEETKKKIGKSNKGKTLGKKHSIEHIKNVADANRGKKHVAMSNETKQKIKNSWVNRKLTPFSKETRKKMSESHKGQKLSKEKKQKFTFKGRKHSKESIEKMSKSQKGKKVSEKTKIKMSNSQKKRFSIKENHPMFKKNMLPKTKNKIRTALLGKKRINYKKRSKKLCEYCKREIDLSNFSRYHGNNCKFKL